MVFYSLGPYTKLFGFRDFRQTQGIDWLQKNRHSVLLVDGTRADRLKILRGWFLVLVHAGTE